MNTHARTHAHPHTHARTHARSSARNASPAAQAMQLTSTALSLGAILPQIALNFRRRSSGEYSPITAAMACVGNLLRVWTTVQLVGHDWLLLGCFTTGVAVQGALLAQITLYGLLREGMSLRQVFLSDCLGKAPSTPPHAAGHAGGAAPAGHFSLPSGAPRQATDSGLSWDDETAGSTPLLADEADGRHGVIN